VNRPSLAIRAVASALTALAMLVTMETPSFARSHKDSSNAPAASAPANGQSLQALIPSLEQQFSAHPQDAQVGAQLADAYLQAKRPDLALNVTLHLISGGQRTPAVMYFTGEAYREVNQPGNAIAAWQMAESLDPSSESILLALTNEYIQTGNLDAALREAKRNATFNVRDERAHLNFGMTLALVHQLDAARAEFISAQSVAPQDSHPLILIGRTFVDGNDPNHAVEAFSRALALDPTSIDALNGLAVSYAMARNTPMAINTLEHALGIVTDPQQKIGIMAQEARLLVQNGQPQVADQALKRGVVAFPNLDIAHLAYGDFLAQTGHLDDAKNQWVQAAGPQQNNPAALSRLGTLALNLNQPGMAVNLFSRVVSASPNDDTAWNNLGQSFLIAHNEGQASTAFHKAYSINHTPDALSGIATCDFIIHNYNEAQQIFNVLSQQANGYVTSNARLLFTMGRTYAVTNQKDKARLAYQRLLAIVPKNTDQERYVRGLLASLNSSQKPNQRQAVPAAKHGASNH
jgi:tetratricopeptide (TPR) repeat protein